MSRPTIPLVIEDVSAFSRALAQQLPQGETRPSHLTLLNMLARAGGYRNFQHLRAVAQVAAAPAVELPLAPAAALPEPQPDPARLRRVARLFDDQGRLVRWPVRRAQQILCLWVLWLRLPRGLIGAERAMNAALNRWHLFGDPAILRRDMVMLGLVSRREDGSDYRRIEQEPPPEALALIRALPAADRL